MLSGINLDHLAGTGLGLALGMLIGIERGWSLREVSPGARFAGIRTFALIGLAGGLGGVLYQHAKGPAVTLLAGVVGLVVIGYHRVVQSRGLPSGTSAIVALLTLSAGFLAGSGERLLATAIAVVMVLVLSMRNQLHGWVSRLSEAELHSIARFALIATVILPLLPDRGYGPYEAWNPRQLWLLVVLVSGFSFAGYFASRMLGPGRGVVATAAAGAMVSSTAVTAAMATRMKQGDGAPAIAAAAIAAASVVMMLRVLVLVGALAPFALASLALLLAPGILISAAATAWFWRSQPSPDQDSGDVELRNPFDLGPALVLTLLVMVLAVIARWVLAEYGDQGLAVVLAISGTVDVDSAIITMGNLPPGSLAPATAGIVLSIPVVLNTLFKASIGLSLGGWKHAGQAALPLLATALAIMAVCVPAILQAG
ncbi:MAG: MgtC/SapB family protein [Sphingomonadaceae bacterium]|nr:MgtC/SapB family protein [Sphingomonadaceae bacterium]